MTKKNKVRKVFSKTRATDLILSSGAFFFFEAFVESFQSHKKPSLKILTF